MRFHWQNLNDYPDPKGSALKAGRAWLHFKRWTAGFEWCHGRSFTHATVNVDPIDARVTISFALPGACYYLSLQDLPRRFFSIFGIDADDEHSIGLRVFDSAIWWSLWENSMESNSADPWWVRGRVRLDDSLKFLLGAVEFKRDLLEARDVQIPMPESAYRAKASLFLDSWTRPRFPWFPLAKKLRRVDIDVPEGVPIPGKGENSYDLDDDKMYSQTGPASSIEEGVGKFVQDVLRMRWNRSGTYGFEPQQEVALS